MFSLSSSLCGWKGTSVQWEKDTQRPPNPPAAGSDPVRRSSLAAPGSVYVYRDGDDDVLTPTQLPETMWSQNGSHLTPDVERTP